MNDIEPSEDSHLESQYEDHYYIEEDSFQYDSGAGTGEDDLADYNQNEADDYVDEGLDDSSNADVTDED